MISNHYKTDHHQFVLREINSEDLLSLVWYLDEPIADAAVIPTYLLSEMAKQYVTVVLTGEGGDEVFGGYQHYYTHQKFSKYQVLPSRINRKVLPLAARLTNRILNRPYFHERTIWFWSLPLEIQSIAWTAIFTEDEQAMISGRFTQQSQHNYFGHQLFPPYPIGFQFPKDITRLMYLDTKIRLPDDLLMKVDKMTMANSLEARTPFLDHELIQFTSSLPLSFKTNRITPKQMLRDIAQKYLPPEIIKRPKHTFDVPVGFWIRNNLRELTIETLQKGEIAGQRILNPRYIFREMWKNLESNIPGSAAQFWALLILGLWAKAYNMNWDDNLEVSSNFD